MTKCKCYDFLLLQQQLMYFTQPKLSYIYFNDIHKSWNDRLVPLGGVSVSVYGVMQKADCPLIFKIPKIHVVTLKKNIITYPTYPNYNKFIKTLSNIHF